MAESKYEEMKDELNFKSLLNEMIKDDLINLSRLFNYEIPTKLKKADFLNALADKIMNEPQTWLPCLTMFELQLLHKLVNAKSDDNVSSLDTFILFPIEEFKLILSESDGQGGIYYYISPELKDAIAPVIDDVIAQKQESDMTEIEQLMIGYSNLEGIYDMPGIMAMAANHYPNKTDEEIFEVFEKSSFLRSITREVPLEDGVLYMTDSPYVRDSEKLAEELYQYRDLKTEMVFTKNELLEAANYPVPTIPNKFADQTRSILMNTLNVSADIANLYMLQQWIVMQNEESSIPFAFLMDDIKFDNKNEFEKIFTTFVEYQNNAPQWMFRGYSSTELGNMNGRRTVTKVPHIAVGEYMQKMGLNITEEMKEVIDVHYEENQYGTKIGRNDSCPCGSGKKYKKCCGNN